MAARKRPSPPTGFVIYEGPSLLTGDPIVCIATLHSTNRKMHGAGKKHHSAAAA